MKIKSETEIIESWKINLQMPLVSICCMTYNQAEYIEDALRGFLMQETDFRYEILIHDDASTDGTKDILVGYQKKYPNIIKLILQETNQYSKGINPFFEYLVPKCFGVYIAICEGDDYWISIDKLQNQVKALKENDGIGICFHSTKIIDCRNGVESFSKIHRKTYFELKELISLGASLMPTASIVAKKSLILDMPDFVKYSPVGDYFIQVCCGINGGLYLDEYYSVYRMLAKNSWTKSNISSVKKFTKNTSEMMCCLEKLNTWLVTKNYENNGINKMKANLILQHIVLSVRAMNIGAFMFAMKYINFANVFHLILLILFKVIKKTTNIKWL
jgi:glycosyltransferase involved in cell wall biosynthesis